MSTQPELTEARIDAIEGELLGTCVDLEHALEEGESEDRARDILAMRSNIELCQQCGWWCETSELDDDSVCEDCQGGITP